MRRGSGMISVGDDESSRGGLLTITAAIKPHVSLETVQFSGAPKWGEDGKGYIPPAEGKPAYVGTPSAEMDAAWDYLVKDRYFLLSDEEAKAAWGEDYEKWWVDERGGYLAGIDMLHSLHCLNHLRQALDPEYYPRLTRPGTEWHHDHCVEHLRQMVMCQGDLTPIPSRWVGNIRQFYVDTDRKHTCRNFEAIRQYASERSNGNLAVPARNQKPHDQ
jgi:Mycotoxin biosynthesis protein UstYa